MLAKGNRSKQVTDACHAHGGFYLGSIGGPAARLAQDCIKKVEVLEYPELGMEAVWRIEVEDFPAFIVVDDKGNDFFASVTKPMASPDTGQERNVTFTPSGSQQEDPDRSGSASSTTCSRPTWSYAEPTSRSAGSTAWPTRGVAHGHLHGLAHRPAADARPQARRRQDLPQPRRAGRRRRRMEALVLGVHLLRRRADPASFPTPGAPWPATPRTSCRADQRLGRVSTPRGSASMSSPTSAAHGRARRARGARAPAHPRRGRPSAGSSTTSTRACSTS